MSVEDHPKYPSWRRALDRMLEEEEHYFQTVATEQTVAIKRRALADLHKARKAYSNVADNLG